jgi:hypothetical protein
VPPLLFGRRVRPIACISQTPPFVGPGELVSEPGYHPEALLWLHPGDLQVGNLPEKPTAEEVAGALGLLDELLWDFPWAGEAARANFLALVLLPYVRPMLNGPTALHLVNAATPCIGKDLLAQLVPILATGQDGLAGQLLGRPDTWPASAEATRSDRARCPVGYSRVTPVQTLASSGDDGGIIPATAGDSWRRSRSPDASPGRQGHLTAPISGFARASIAARTSVCSPRNGRKRSPTTLSPPGLISWSRPIREWVFGSVGG